MDFNSFIKTYQREEVLAVGNQSVSKPLVTVCIQTFNHSEYILECLNSVVNQKTNFDFEILIGEDESSDGTREKCLEFAKSNSDITTVFLHSRKNNIKIKGNPSGRFNMMYNIFSAKGKYIALLEGDDYWIDPFKLQKQVDLLENNQNIVACHHWQKIAEKVNGSFKEVLAPKEGHGYCADENTNVKKIFTNDLRLKSRTLMFRNIINDNFFPDWFTSVTFGDVPLTFILGKHGDFTFIDEEMAVYRQTGKGVSTSGLEEMGEAKFRIQHLKNWIEIWDRADALYDYKYHKEAVKTVVSFYEIIVSKLPVGLSSYIGLLDYNIKERQLPFFKTLPHSLWIFKLIVKTFVSKVKKKLRKR